MMTSSKEAFFALLAICAGNSPVTGIFPTLRPVTRSFVAFFDLCLNKRLNKQSCDLRRHLIYYDVIAMVCFLIISAGRACDTSCDISNNIRFKKGSSWEAF